MLVKNYEQIKIIEELELNKNTVSQWMAFVRMIFEEWAMRSSEQIGGEGQVVEIDESKFGKRKYNKGHHVEGQWVFGGIERSTGKIFLVPVEKRDRETLTAIIVKWIKPGTTIMSDCWKAYDKLQEIGYHHLKVNHSINFVDKSNGAHTNAIESTWRHAKRFCPEYSRYLYLSAICYNICYNLEKKKATRVTWHTICLSNKPKWKGKIPFTFS